MDKDKLFNENRGLIKFCIKKLNSYYESEDEFKEIESVANLGMARGINTYDPTMNIKISTYLTTCICNEISKYFYTKTREKRINEFGKDISLSSYLGKDEEDTIEEIIPSDVNIEQTVIDDMYKKEMLEKAINVLKPKHKEMIISYFGLYDAEQLNFEELGKKYHMSKTSASDYIQRALKRMRKEIEKCL